MTIIQFTLILPLSPTKPSREESSIFNDLPYLVQDSIVTVSLPKSTLDKERAEILGIRSGYCIYYFRVEEKEIVRACNKITNRIIKRSKYIQDQSGKFIVENSRKSKVISLKRIHTREIFDEIYNTINMESGEPYIYLIEDLKFHVSSDIIGDALTGKVILRKVDYINFSWTIFFAILWYVLTGKIIRDALNGKIIMILLTSSGVGINRRRGGGLNAGVDGINIGNAGVDGIDGIDIRVDGGISYESLQNATRQSDDYYQSRSDHFDHALIRYPNLDCPDKVTLNQRFSLTIDLLIDKPEGLPEPLYGVLSLLDTRTEELPEVEVVLSHSGFDLEGSNTQIMQVERDDDSSVRFVLIPRQQGQQKIKVQFYQNGKPSGKAVRNILVSEQPVSLEVPQPEKLNEIEFKTTLTIPPQDLELYIDLADDSRTLSFGLHSVKQEIDYHRTKLGQVILQGSPLEKMQSVYKEMTQLAQRMPTTAEDRAWAEHRLESVGNELWDELIPEQLKQEYWKFKSRVTSVLITSEEPWIPWEILKPYRDNDDGEQENDLFWCQQFAMSRWLSGAGTADELDIKTARSIAPAEVNLPSVKEEVAFLEQLSGLRANVTPLTTFSSRMQVLDCLKNEDLSVLHFACHGMFDSTSPNDSAIKLSDGALRPSDIRVRFGGKRQRPLIFINACHGGRAEFGFTGMGGWAERMVNARAGAFIGAMWEVSDKLSLQFAKTFYTSLLQENKSIAESFRQAREELRRLAPYNSTWLAYTLYADPEGRVKD